MIFNSVTFLCFFISFFIFYWFVFNKNLKTQNLLLLSGSFIFYGWSDWRILFFLIAVIAFNFWMGIAIEKTKSETIKKQLIFLAMLQGIGGLAFFKYYNFFISSLNHSLEFIGISSNAQTLNILVPLGISFFTFKTISYILDISKGKINATTDWIVFSNYVSFFPSLLSGPIDKSIKFVPQLEKKRVFNYDFATDGLRQILWGFFKKVLIANNCAILVSEIFDNYSQLPASSLFIGAFLYAIQIYADFSGYSDIAIGIAKLLGFSISKNFDFPFFSQNIAEYWRKWHISLTSWVTEYVFIPLSIYFRDYNKIGLFLAIMINLLVVGIWHGANWTFVLYGFVHGLLFIPLIINGTMLKRKKIDKNKFLPTAMEFYNMSKTFLIIMLTMIIFRASTITDAFLFYNRLVSVSIFTVPVIDLSALVITLFYTALMFFIEWICRFKEHGLQIDSINNKYFRWSIYLTIIFSSIVFGVFTENQFIYFKF